VPDKIEITPDTSLTAAEIAALPASIGQYDIYTIYF